MYEGKNNNLYIKKLNFLRIYRRLNFKHFQLPSFFKHQKWNCNRYVFWITIKKIKQKPCLADKQAKGLTDQTASLVFTAKDTSTWRDWPFPSREPSELKTTVDLFIISKGKWTVHQFFSFDIFSRVRQNWWSESLR